MRIGELSKRTGVSPRSLRYYEQQGLLTSERLTNGYRDYADTAVDIVASIQNLLAAGMNTELIRDVLPALDCGVAPRICEGEGAALLARVRAVRDELRQQARRIDVHAAALDRYLALVPEPG
jgi:DNA-binding transcriptional MerR regulator